MPPPPSRIAFAEFEFDPAAGELWHRGVRVALQPQPARLLALLLSRPGEVVSRDEIRQALWGGETHVEFDRSLNFCVAKLRAALQDNAGEPRFVETVPTRGYRFIAAPQKAALPGSDPGKTPLTPGPEPGQTPAWHRSGTGVVPHVAESASVQRVNRRRNRVAYAATVVVVAAVAAFATFRMSAVSPKVVVVPFRNETGVADLDRVAKGVSDATVVKLAESSELQVIGNAAGLAFSFRPPDLKAMGESLGAQYLVLGQVKRDDRRMRVVAHLIRVSDQTHVWAQTFDSDTLDLPQQSAVADQIAAAVAARLRPRGKS
jgi:TolB-like protein/DNA-binding winged helix-turn-helix (wHTH) protein